MKTKYLVLNLLAAASLLLSPAAQASKIYTCESGGKTVYTTRPQGNCHSADLPPIGKYSSSRYDAPQPAVSQSEPKAAKAVKPKNTAKTKTPVAPIRPTETENTAAAPKAPANNSRRSILEAELSNERKALNEAQKSLAQARAAKGGTIDHQQVKNLESSVMDRQQNIQALQRELSRM